MDTMNKLSRRSFVTGSATLAAGAALAAPAALADEATSADRTSTTAACADTPAWLGTAPEVAEDQIAETLECDVLVVGYGTAGLFAACTAAG